MQTHQQSVIQQMLMVWNTLPQLGLSVWGVMGQRKPCVSDCKLTKHQYVTTWDKHERQHWVLTSTLIIFSLYKWCQLIWVIQQRAKWEKGDWTQKHANRVLASLARELNPLLTTKIKLMHSRLNQHKHPEKLTHQQNSTHKCGKVAAS